MRLTYSTSIIETMLNIYLDTFRWPYYTDYSTYYDQQYLWETTAVIIFETMAKFIEIRWEIVEWMRYCSNGFATVFMNGHRIWRNQCTNVAHRHCKCRIRSNSTVKTRGANPKRGEPEKDLKTVSDTFLHKIWHNVQAQIMSHFATNSSCYKPQITRLHVQRIYILFAISANLNWT